jgi:hypothetical protein
MVTHDIVWVILRDASDKSWLCCHCCDSQHGLCMIVVPWFLGCSGVVICAGVRTDSCSSMSCEIAAWLRR